MNKPLVIAISSVSGGGKTTIINALNDKLHHSKVLHFDGYDNNERNLDKLAKDIESVKAIPNLEYVLLDYPFAYKNDKIAPYIDYAIFIDTPLDIAMARRILRGDKEDLNYYISKERTAYLEMLKSVKPNSDCVVDGTQSVDEIIFEILSKIFSL